MLTLLFLLVLVSTQTVPCYNYLAPECPTCLKCDANNNPITLSIFNIFNVSSFIIPTRIGLYTTITTIRIALPYQNLPTELALLRNLTYLGINMSPLNQTTPLPDFSAFTQLQVLRLLVPNLIPTNQLSVMLQAKNMTHLEVEDSRLTNLPPYLSTFSHLTYLRLSRNAITGTIPSLINCTRLTHINLGGNLLSGTVSNQFPIALTYLDISSNQLSGIVDFPTLTVLKYLDISFNSFFGTVPNLPTNAWRVKASNNHFTNISTSRWTPNTLDVSYNNISYFYFPFFPPTLDISFNYLTTIDTNNSYVYPLQNLLINVIGNRISDNNSLYSLDAAIIKLFPQDVNECIDGTHSCDLNSSICSDGWNPVLSYTCSCKSGYRAVGPNICVDIDECKEYSPCNSFACLNLPGSYFCCPSGFYLKDGICVDVNECYPNVLGLTTNCTVDYCYNNNGSYGCCSNNTYSDGLNCLSCNVTQVFAYSNLEHLKSLIGYNLSYTSCYGTCNNAQRISLIQVPSKACKEYDTLSITFCNYPCVGLIYDDPSGAIFALKEELSKIIPMYLSFTDNTLTISSISDLNFSSQLEALIMEIVPNISNPEFVYGNDSLTLISTKNDTTIVITKDFPLLAVILPIILTGVVVLLIVGYFIFRSDPIFAMLPKEVILPYRSFVYPISRWLSSNYQGNSNSGYYYERIELGSSKAKSILSYYDFSSYTISDITLIYNPTLFANFVGNYSILLNRLENSADVFGRKKWERKDGTSNGAENVYSRYQQLCTKYSWNVGSLPILPVCHGTEFALAQKICETGFANLSSLDAGWYGKGIYFTSYPTYCRSYVETKRHPCIILSWILPGNTYPVIENTTDENNLLGKPLKSGYQSHFVVTDSKGHAKVDGEFNEFVIPQESQIVPYAIISL